MKIWKKLLDRVHLEFIGNASHCIRTHFGVVTWRPYCPGRPEKLCFTTPSIAVETIGGEAWENKAFSSPRTIWAPCDNGDHAYAITFIVYSIQVFSSHDDEV